MSKKKNFEDFISQVCVEKKNSGEKKSEGRTPYKKKKLVVKALDECNL